MRSISPLVDLYNAVSLRHALPCGGEDRAAIVGDVRLTRAAGGEPFRTIGAAEDDPALRLPHKLRAPQGGRILL